MTVPALRDLTVSMRPTIDHPVAMSRIACFSRSVRVLGVSRGWREVEAEK